MSLVAADPPAGEKRAPRAELGIEVKAVPRRPGDIDLQLTLTNKSRELLVNTWLHDRFDGVDFLVTGPDGRPVKTRPFARLTTNLSSEPNYIVLKPGETRRETIDLLAAIPDRKLPAGKYRVKAVYTNTFQDEKYESKEIEVVVPPIK